MTEICPAMELCTAPGQDCQSQMYNADPFKLAEDICVNASLENTSANPSSFNYTSRAGWAYTELALNTPEDDDAVDAFNQASRFFSYIVNQADPTTSTWFHAAQSASYVPIFSARRYKDKPEQELVEDAYTVVGELIGKLLPCIQNLRENDRDVSKLLGTLAEFATAGLVARTQHLPYPTSCREGVVGGNRNHDLYTVKNGSKHLLVESKFKFTNNNVDYDKRILLVPYASICREVAEATWEAHNRPTLNSLAVQLARAASREATRKHLSRSESELLAAGTSVLENRIRNHQKQLRRKNTQSGTQQL